LLISGEIHGALDARFAGACVASPLAKGEILV